MYSHSDIEDAVEGGALTTEQASSLRNFVARRTGTPTADEEHVRWLLGFNDYYVFASSILLLIGLGWLGYKVGDGRSAQFVIPLLVAAGCWGLSEYFVKRKRLALTGIALAYGFTYSVGVTIMLLAAEVLGPGGDRTTFHLVVAVSAAVAGGGAFLYWKRFALPVAISLIAGAAAVAIMSLINMAVPADPEGTVSYLVMTLIGIATLAYAVTWEAKDIHRTTKTADIAFWLHMTAIWEVVFGLAGLLGLMGYISTGAAIGAIIAFLVLALVGIVLDRRVYVLGGAWLFGVGLHALIKGDSGYRPPYGGGYNEYGVTPYDMPYSPYGGVGDTIDNVMLTILIVGVVLVVIGMFWTQIRGMLGGLAGPLAGKVPATSHKDSESQAFE